MGDFVLVFSQVSAQLSVTSDGEFTQWLQTIAKQHHAFAIAVFERTESLNADALVCYSCFRSRTRSTGTGSGMSDLSDGELEASHKEPRSRKFSGQNRARRNSGQFSRLVHAVSSADTGNRTNTQKAIDRPHRCDSFGCVL